MNSLKNTSISALRSIRTCRGAGGWRRCWRVWKGLELRVIWKIRIFLSTALTYHTADIYSNYRHKTTPQMKGVFVGTRGCPVLCTRRDSNSQSSRPKRAALSVRPRVHCVCRSVLLILIRFNYHVYPEFHLNEQLGASGNFNPETAFIVWSLFYT